MDALGGAVLLAGLFWLTRRTLAEGLIRERGLSTEQIAARGRFFEWLAALPAWPGGALILIGGFVIWM